MNCCIMILIHLDEDSCMKKYIERYMDNTYISFRPNPDDDNGPYHSAVLKCVKILRIRMSGVVL